MSHDESRVSCAIGVTNLWSIQTKSEVIVLPTQTLHYSRESLKFTTHLHCLILCDAPQIGDLMIPVQGKHQRRIFFRAFIFEASPNKTLLELVW